MGSKSSLEGEFCTVRVRVGQLHKNEEPMTRHKSLLTKVSSFLVLLSLFVRKGLAHNIESAIKIATVGPNVYLGSEGVKKCDEELGITSGAKLVPDSGMTSSSYNKNYPPHEGRLLSDKWWQPVVHERGQFLMVDLQRLTVVRQSLVQGGRDSGISGARVLSYLIYHSINGETWFPILEREHVKLFMGNIDNSELISRNYFPEPVMARFVKFYPQKWITSIALRVELYGCPAGFDPPLGMSSKAILDEKISASSTQSKAFHPSYGRLHLNIGAGGWCALEQNTEQYFEITLADGYSSKYVMSAVATQGILTIKSWVRSYYFSYNLVSSLEWTFYHDSNKRKLFVGNTDETTVVTNHFMGLVVARKIRIHPQTWEKSICLRAEVYGIDYYSSRNDLICNYGPDKVPKCHGFGKVCIASSSKTHQVFTCVCKVGFVGSARTCEDLNECSVAYNTCPENEYCYNGEGFFACKCQKGYLYDFNSSACKDVDECAGHARDVCPYLTDCVNTDGSFTCDCNEPGYLTDGNNCVDIDECEIGNHTCLGNSTCVNAAGSFRCFCNKGFAGDGSKACYDIDECETNHEECGTYGVCVNTAGSYLCACKQGFVVRGNECEDVDECATEHAVCQDNALCVNIPGSFACQCKLGYSISDLACRDINECQTDLAECDKQADCYNTIGSYLCICNKGLYGDGFYCSESELDGQCLEEDEECAAALSKRTRAKSKARLNAAARRAVRMLSPDVIKAEDNSPDDTPENSNADVRIERDVSEEKSNSGEKKAAALKKSTGQSLLKLKKWILIFPSILLNHLLLCG